jgi:hypothetical protein
MVNTKRCLSVFVRRATALVVLGAWAIGYASWAMGAAQEPRRQTPEETAMYEAGLRAAREGKRMQTDSLEIAIEKGFLASLKGDGIEYLPAGQPAPLMTLRVDGEWRTPTGMTWLEEGRRLALHVDGVTVEIALEAKRSHLRMELARIEGDARVDLAVWGPWPTTIGKKIGDTIGVVRDDAWAIGIQSLNPKTIGGCPDSEADEAPRTTWGDDAPMYRGNVAMATDYGSRLQAYVRDRSRDRVVPNWGQPAYEVPAYDDGGLVGSAVALFGCPADKALETIGAIELAEGLPHPLMDGVWAKTSKEMATSLFITIFGENNIDEAIRITKQAGLKYLYHQGPFDAWGHFTLRRDQFPNGWDGFRTCVEKAEAQGVHVGFHMLSNFIRTHDAYVSPVPDPRLARIGSTTLAEPLDAAQNTVRIADTAYFTKPTTLNTIVVEKELIRFEKADGNTLLNCERGAFRTRASAHEAGADVGRLMDHPYKVFLGNLAISREMAERTAAFCNHTGARMLAFDGIEGNLSTGLGRYGETLWTKAFYDALDPRMAAHFFNAASRPGHFKWHYDTRMEWGEPWRAGFREAQIDYRIKNQDWYDRNFLPRMLGWFVIRADTTLSDIEWLCSLAAGWDAGFCLVRSMKSNGDQIQEGAVKDQAERETIGDMLDAVREWETARLAGAFPEDLKPALRDLKTDWHLEPAGDGTWDLYRVVDGVKGKPQRIARAWKVRETP